MVQGRRVLWSLTTNEFRAGLIAILNAARGFLERVVFSCFCPRLMRLYDDILLNIFERLSLDDLLKVRTVGIYFSILTKFYPQY